MVKSVVELHLDEVRHLNDAACVVAILTKNEDRVDVLLQIEEPRYPFDEINAVRNSPQDKCKMKQSIETERVDDSSVLVEQKYQERMKGNPGSEIQQFFATMYQANLAKPISILATMENWKGRRRNRQFLVESVFGKCRSSNSMMQFSKGRSKRTASRIISV